MPSTALRHLCATVLTLFALLAPSQVVAHRTSPTNSLRSLIASSDLVVYARVLGPGKVAVQRDGAAKHRSVVRIRVLEVLKGPSKKDRSIRFAQHGHGVAEYQAGEEALICLKAIEGSAELSSLGSQSSLRWYSPQEEDDDYKLSRASRAPTLTAARAYVALAAAPREQRAEGIHRITVKLLTSKDRRLAVSALRDLRRSGDAIRITSEDVPALEKVVYRRDAAIEVRVGVLAELDRRDLLDGDPHWAQLLLTTSGSERRVVIGAVAAHPGPRANQALLKILAGSDPFARSEAAVSLGYPGNDAAVEPLSKALFSDDTRLAMAAIRGLGGIGSDKARAALSSAAASQPDETIRRRARSELLRLDR